MAQSLYTITEESVPYLGHFQTCIRVKEGLVFHIWSKFRVTFFGKA